MTSSGRACLPAMLAGVLIAGVCLQGCVATTVAGVGLGLAGATIGTAAKITTSTIGTAAKVAGAALHLTARRPPKKATASR